MPGWITNLEMIVKPLVAAGVFSLTWLLYQQGITGDLFYDDISFLGPLADFNTSADAWDFVLNGSGGPLGRPIALLSFLPHADGWPDTSLDARTINVVIHLANGFLLFLLAYQILRLRDPKFAGSSYWIALMAAALWMALPMLASTSLITVQRWTGLAMLLGLIGLNLFVAGYFLQHNRARLALALQAGGLGGFTLLALFTKESGALFPIYALVIDAVLLKNVAGPLWARRLRQGALWAGLLALLVYLSPLYRDWFAVSDFRGWSSFERLQTQLVLLWEYIYLAFVPQIGFYGPFHDDVQLVDGWLLPLISLAGFVLLTLAAFWYRDRNPWFLFALLWFFTGHLIESTVIHLELMFEHRNYLAVFGFCFALAALAWQAPGKLKKTMPAALGLYIVIMWGALYATTSIWGKPIEAAENWAENHPESPRAIAHLGGVYYEELGDSAFTARMLDQKKGGCTNCADLYMQSMLFLCGAVSPAQIDERYDELVEMAPKARASISLIDGFYPVQELIGADDCPPLNEAKAQVLVEHLLANPNFRAWQYQVHLLFHAAYFAKEQGEVYEALEFLARAEARRPQVMPILQMQAHLLMEEGEHAAALKKIEQRRQLDDRDRFMSDEALDELRDAVIAHREGKDHETDRPDSLLQ